MFLTQQKEILPPSISSAEKKKIMPIRIISPLEHSRLLEQDRLAAEIHPESRNETDDSEAAGPEDWAALPAEKQQHTLDIIHILGSASQQLSPDIFSQALREQWSAADCKAVAAGRSRPSNLRMWAAAFNHSLHEADPESADTSQRSNPRDLAMWKKVLARQGTLRNEV